MLRSYKQIQKDRPSVPGDRYSILKQDLAYSQSYHEYSSSYTIGDSTPNESSGERGEQAPEEVVEGQCSKRWLCSADLSLT
mmetsp:Transcript_12899/g.20272  ORF Transcript_12899/g.20272 Transcript_12899/m.20272 type:complete len:81 (-) Transcript_12899:1126-1368(-)